jgi:hypothetical protein
MALGQMQIDGGVLQGRMAQQKLDCPQIGAGFDQMRGEAMPKSVPGVLPVGVDAVGSWKPPFSYPGVSTPLTSPLPHLPSPPRQRLSSHGVTVQMTVRACEAIEGSVFWNRIRSTNITKTSFFSSRVSTNPLSTPPLA